jgi:homotetrameric cytidine deaminase
MPRINVELKARDPDPQHTLESALALGADDRGELVQRDTYFARASGRLKLREQEPGEAELIAYARPDSPEPEVSSYTLAPVADPATLREALERAYGSTVVVAKRRRLLIWEGVRIHLDDVEGLGTFVEFEAVAQGDDLDADRAKVERLRAELVHGELVAGGYADLLLDVPDALLRAADQAMRNSHSPYSHFKVGAALRTASGAVYAAANVENAAYPQSQCAEASAIGSMVAAGERRIVAVAVVAQKRDFCPPCGGCRQRLSEFASAETPVHLGRPGGPAKTVELGALLPLSFGVEDLAGAG